jgi:excisionase family DNA binding protein
MRVNHNDPELARHELAEMRSLVKDVVYPEYDYTPSEYTVEEYATKQRVSKQTVWRWIKANKIVARRIGKSYRISA